ncbi:MAG: hypothetical protein CL679_14315 [Bermanella sp.]|nr:hypothetical protein [Bermanella sp.]
MTMPLIDVHIITGFLGVGKTSCIKHLIENKPSHERWAILVNEYGQQGIDGQLFHGDELVVKQVAGGCACCAALLPFQTALNQLIRHDKPHRIFIEPSGLGHVDNVATLLQDVSYQNRLKLNGIVCVIDPQHLSQPKYRYHELYLRQLYAADVFVANKCDIASEQDLSLFRQLAADFQRQYIEIEQAQLTLQTIKLDVSEKQQPFQIHQNGAHFHTQVMYFAGDDWHMESLVQALSALGLARIKGLMIQGDQVAVINISDRQASLSYSPLSLIHQQQGVIECIDTQPIDVERINTIVTECRKA